ncbi:Transmembrane protein 19-like [Oopsacas minuta]|uniref:Transmembrane protein 19 n=1 Tax=Oopsacas minuta TaxID=111878 RepID=A0AAV7JX39_9METZ|nr:Transmembrane protein 19-like [Oopsacas minuta]
MIESKTNDGLLYLISMQNNTTKEVLTYLIFLPILLGVTGYIFGPYYAKDLFHFTVSFVLTLIIAVYGYKRKSLSIDGAMYSVIVGHTLTFANAAFFSCLITFFLTGSKLTKYKSAKKFANLEQEHITGGRRTYLQVLCNGLVSTICAMGYILYGGQGITGAHVSRKQLQYEFIARLPYIHPVIFELGVVVSLASACGDTWASEIGSAIGGVPRLIIRPFGKPVPVGTNGGVTLYGTIASFMGGGVIGIAYVLTGIILNLYMSYSQGTGISLDLQGVYRVFHFFAFAGIVGFLGSAVDSLIGGTFQYSGINDRTNKVSENKSECTQHISGWDILDNNMVNLVSIAIVTVAVCCVLYKMDQ